MFPWSGQGQRAARLSPQCARHVSRVSREFVPLSFATRVHINWCNARVHCMHKLSMHVGVASKHFGHSEIRPACGTSVCTCVLQGVCDHSRRASPNCWHHDISHKLFFFLMGVGFSRLFTSSRVDDCHVRGNPQDVPCHLLVKRNSLMSVAQHFDPRSPRAMLQQVSLPRRHNKAVDLARMSSCNVPTSKLFLLSVAAPAATVQNGFCLNAVSFYI